MHDAASSERKKSLIEMTVSYNNRSHLILHFSSFKKQEDDDDDDDDLE